MKAALLSVRAGRLRVQVATPLGYLEWGVETLEEVARVQRLYAVYCSSSVDFPEEYTDDATVIALCRHLRGGDDVHVSK